MQRLPGWKELALMAVLMATVSWAIGMCTSHALGS